MYCNNCGHEIHEDETFCPTCGKMLNDNASAFNSQEAKEKVQNDENGIIALSCGIISLFFSWIPIISFVCSIVSFVFAYKTKNSPFKIAGIATGIIGLVISLCFLIYYCIILLVTLPFILIY